MSATLGENPESEHDGALDSEVARLSFASGSQMELLEALGKQHRRLAQTYEGALAHLFRRAESRLPRAIGTQHSRAIRRPSRGSGSSTDWQSKCSPHLERKG